MSGQRLKQLRMARGLSLEALAAKLGGIVTKQALSKYENGRAQPSVVVATRLAVALGVKAANLWIEPSIRVEFMAYRKGSGLLRRDQENVKGLVRQTLEERIRLQLLQPPTNGPRFTVKEFPVKTLDEAEETATTIRDRWKLGLEPIGFVTGVLEDHLIHVLEIASGEKFDGISAVVRNDDGQTVAAAVVTRRGLPAGRQRLNLAHELGHLVLDPGEELDEEQAAFRFAGALLAPAATIHRDVGYQRTSIGADELLLLKQRYGMSLQALLHRLHDLGVISGSYYKQWCIDINRLGWRKREPAELPPEQSQWLPRTVLRSLAEGLITKEEAEQVLGTEVGGRMPLSLVERRSFMKLPVDERRRILAEQAEKLAGHYEQETEWRDLQGGDIVE